MTETIVLTLSYDGTALAGFARQPGQDTVQGRLETALGTILRMPVTITGAGRTDAGVHALGQVVSFDATGNEPGELSLVRSLNALAGPDIVVSSVRSAPSTFSARYSAVSREYRYRIVPGPIAPVFLSRYSWWLKSSFDLGAMREAASHLVGEHDFRSFCVAGSAEGKRTSRFLESVDIAPDIQMGEHCIVIRIVGNAFLHSMVRIIVGTLVEVGRGSRRPDWILEVLAAGDRAVAGQTAPAHGLTLWHVGYPDESWL